MTKWCKNCGHKKGNHTVWRERNYDGEYTTCQHKKENGDICGCMDFELDTSKTQETKK